jgi:hypothetical protein
MSPAPRKRTSSSRNGGIGGGNSGGHGNRPKEPKPAADLWRAVPALPDPLPISPGGDPGALLRSLGDPPLPAKGAVSAHYVAAVVERAAVLAAALATSANLLNRADPD